MFKPAVQSELSNVVANLNAQIAIQSHQFERLPRRWPSTMVYLAVMDEDNKLTHSISKWLREQGYPLEMRTARELRARKISTTLGWFYSDVESNQQRETDIYAHARRYYPDDDSAIVQVVLAIECKSSKSKPWILLSDGPTKMVPLARRSQHLMSPNRDWVKPHLRTAGKMPLLDGYSPCGYSLVRAFAADNQDVAYGAMLSAAKAAAGIQRWHNEARSGDLIFNCVVLPVLLVDAPLFQCELGDDGEEQLTPIERGTIEWRYRVTPHGPPHTQITIITPAALPGLAEDMHTTVDELLRVTTQPHLEVRAESQELLNRTRLKSMPKGTNLGE